MVIRYSVMSKIKLLDIVKCFQSFDACITCK
jgi:Ni,Fe-hydrogenase I large subunit